MSGQNGEVLILGIGNILMRDEGVGAHVARYLARAGEDNGGMLPPDIRAVDGGTLGLDLLPMITEARAVVFVDAVDSGRAPGQVGIWKGPDLEPGLSSHLSAHEIGTADLLALGRLIGSLPQRVALVGIQPGAIEVGVELSPPVQTAVPIAASLARRQAQEFAEEEEIDHA
jgi:hydrogenase maturation protease